MKKRGLILAGAGITLGFIIGITILTAKEYAKEQLVGLLKDLVSSSCDCEFKVDRIDISLLTLRATAKNPRIESGGKVALKFAQLKASFGLSDIFNRIVYLSEIRLINGDSDGVGPDSPTYKFIDYLAAPLPPERDTPDRWKIKLLKLVLQNSSFEEPLDPLILRGDGTSLVMERNQDDNFVLKPIIDTLSIRGKTTTFVLGHVTGSVLFNGDTIDYDSARVTLKQAWVEANGRSFTREKNRVDAGLSLVADETSIGAPSWAKAQVRGRGSIGGTLEFPKISGTFEAPRGEASIHFDPFTAKPLDSLTGAFSIFRDSRGTTFTFPTIDGLGEGVRLSVVKPIIIHRGDITGELSAEGTLQYGDDVFLRDLRGRISLSGAADEPTVRLHGGVGAVDFFRIILKNLDASVNYQGGKLSINGSRNGDSSSVKISADLDMNATPHAKISSGAVDLVNSPLFGEKGDALLSGSFLFSGQTALDLIRGSGEYSLRLPAAGATPYLQGKLSLGQGILSSTGATPSGALTAQSELTLVGPKRSSITVKLNRFTPQEMDPSIECVEASGELLVNYPGTRYDLGDGTLNLAAMSFGCEPHTLRLSAPTTLRFQGGSARVDGVRFKGLSGDFSLSGTIAPSTGYSLSASGTTALESFLPLLPRFDDLRGTLAANVSISGPLLRPVLKGAAQIRDGEFWMESAAINGERINGGVVLSEGALAVQDLEGIFNGGPVKVSGTIQPTSIQDSALSLNARDVTVNPFVNTTATVSTQLDLKRGSSGHPTISGTITIDEGQFEKNLDLKTIIRALSGYLFARVQNRQTQNVLPTIDLDVAIRAPRNLFISTNLVSAELKTDLRLSGDINNPVIEGEMTTISGWLQLKDTRFEMTSGRILFRPGDLEPQLQVIAETYLRSYAGDSVLVFLEGSGPLTDPRITLSSEEGLSEREILNMISFGSSASSQTIANNPTGSTFGESSLLDDTAEFSLARFLRDLTKINSLTLEPKYNQRSGAIEPALVARKNISTQLALVSENSFSGNESNSRVALLYDVTPFVNVAGGLDAFNSNQQTALSLDLTYTVLARQRQFLKLSVVGNRKFSTQRVLAATRLNNNSRIPRLDTDRLRKTLVDFYQADGYHSASARIECQDDGIYCRDLTLSVKEGPRSLIDTVRMEGVDQLPPYLARSLTPPNLGTPASERTIQDVASRFTKLLRSEGFIAARVTGEYIDSLTPNRKGLHLTVSPGAPVTFIFTGNTAFGSEDFLETISLFTRRQPFGSNTINILVENIERLYRESGYLFVSLTVTPSRDTSSNRTTYTVTIDEGSRLPVRTVNFQGTAVSREELSDALIKNAPTRRSALFSPRYAIQEELEINKELIRNTLVEMGYPDASVTYDIHPDGEDSSVSITYIIVEGARVAIGALTIDGYPTNLGELTPPKLPCSIPEINRFIGTISNELKEGGYLSPEIWSELLDDGNTLTVHTTPGTQTIVDSIEITGNLNIDPGTLWRSITIAEGMPWQFSAVEESRRHLLRLGLFSRVDIVPADGALDSSLEKMLIKVEERPLQTFEIGTGINSEDGLRFFGEATDRGIFKDGKSLSLRFDTFYDVEEASVSKGFAALRYSDPALSGSDFRLTEDLRFQRIALDTLEFDLDRISLASSLYRSWEGGLSLTLGHTYLSENLDKVTQDSIIGEFDTGTVDLSFFSGIVTLDKRDSPLNPTRGFTLSGDYRIASSALGSDAQYYGVGGRGAFVYPLPFLNGRVSVANNTKVAGTWVYGGTNEVPITQRYYLGGRTTVRGFRENSLGPRGENGGIIGGDLLFFNNLELRYLFQESVSLYSFLDAGTVFLRERSLSIDDLRESLGVGLRYLSPIGPIGLDFGFPLDERGGEPSVRVHFSIGSNF